MLLLKKIGEISAIVVVLVLAIYLRVVNLDYPDFQNDEFYHLNTAVGYLQTGKFVEWDFLQNEATKEYPRAWPYTWLVAQSFRLFGVGEWQGRLPSVIFGIALLPLIYWFAFKITQSRLIAFLSLYLVSFDQTFIWAARTTRMYAIFVFFALLAIYLLARKRWFWLGIVFLFFSYLLHEEALLIIAGLYFYLLIFLLYRFFKKDLKWDKYSIGFLVLSCLIILFFIVHLFIKPLMTKDFLSLLSSPHWQYFNSSFDNLRLVYFGWIFLILGLLLWRRFDKIKVYYLSIIVPILAFFVFLAAWHANKKYILFIVPLIFIFYLDGLVNVFKKLLDNHRLAYLLVILIFFIFTPLPKKYVRNYWHQFQPAYQFIESNYQVGEPLLIQGPKTFYFSRQDLKIINLNENFSLADFKEVYKANKSGWLVWPKYKSYHVQKTVKWVAWDYLDWQEEISQKTNLQIFRWEK